MGPIRKTNLKGNVSPVGPTPGRVSVAVIGCAVQGPVTHRNHVVISRAATRGRERAGVVRKHQLQYPMVRELREVCHHLAPGARHGVAACRDWRWRRAVELREVPPGDRIICLRKIVECPRVRKTPTAEWKGPKIAERIVRIRIIVLTCQRYLNLKARGTAATRPVHEEILERQLVGQAIDLNLAIDVSNQGSDYSRCSGYCNHRIRVVLRILTRLHTANKLEVAAVVLVA